MQGNQGHEKRITAPLHILQMGKGWITLRGAGTTRSLSAIIPAYNEEDAIAETLLCAIEVLETLVPDFEILVVDDGSKDRTGVIIESFVEADERVRVLHHSENRGYGAALISGLAAATKELIFFMDADGQFDIRDIAKFLPLIEQYDAVLGYRIDRKDGAIRKFNTWCWRVLVGMMLGIHVRDIDCAFKLYKHDFFRLHRLETHGVMVHAEILYKFFREGYSYIEVGVRHQPRRSGQATGAKPAVILQALRELFYYAPKWQHDPLV
jgi:glycosyltransferase involved in cell wall biosynthesis